MPFSFKADEYKNTFPAEVIESVTMPNPNKPTEEILQMTLLRLRFNANKGEWESQETPYPCQLPGCTINPWHNHIRYYESNRAGSPSHKFILSVSANTNIIFMAAKDLMGKRLVWEEEIWPARTNPQTGLKGKDQYYYFVASELGAEHAAASTAQNEELPFDAGSPDNLATNPTPAQAPTQISQPTTNGVTNPAEGRAMTIEDAAIVLSQSMDGKTKAEVQKIITQDEMLRSTPGFLVAFMQNRVVEMLTRDNFITEDAGGVYHLVTS